MSASRVMLTGRWSEESSCRTVDSVGKGQFLVMAMSRMSGCWERLCGTRVGSSGAATCTSGWRVM